MLGPFRQLGGQAYFSLSIGLGGMVVLIRISPQTVSKEDVSMQYGGRQWSRPYCMEELTLQTTHLAQIYCDLLYMDLSHYISYLP